MAYINENWDRLHPGEVSSWNTIFFPPHSRVLKVSGSLGTYELLYGAY